MNKKKNDITMWNLDGQKRAYFYIVWDYLDGSIGMRKVHISKKKKIIIIKTWKCMQKDKGSWKIYEKVIMNMIISTQKIKWLNGDGRNLYGFNCFVINV